MSIFITPMVLALAITPEPSTGHDHHHRPAAYDDITLAVPPHSGGAPDYPRAAGVSLAHSSNYTAGGLTSPQYVVVHTMQGYYAGSISWFQNPDANVSAHYCMRAEDGEITQTVRDQDRAWHVGGSNPVALGIEHEGFIDEPGWYTWPTYVESARLARWLCDTHDIPVDRDHIVGHVELPGQTHTDPGPLWDWDLYMALIHDVVPAGRVEGVVVDRSRACSVDASADTWLKATPEASDTLGDDQLCWVAAGTELQVIYEHPPLGGHRRLVLDPDEPCAQDLGQTVFAFEGHVEGACSPNDLALDVQLRLDGELAADLDAQGRFSFDGVSAGAHVLDVEGADVLGGAHPLDLEVYPGARVVVAVDPVGAPPPEDDEDDPEPEPGGDDAPGADEGGEDSTGDAPTDDPGAIDDDGYDAALPPGFGTREGGCTCRGSGRSPGSASLALLALAWRRRRRRRRA